MFSTVSKIILALFISSHAAAQPPARWGDWQKWGDQGNGFYRNPVLPADYSDPDCIRVGDDYYAISSTFQYSPGIVILHSKDLVNWSVLGHAVHDITTISTQLNYNKMNRYGKGIWAGAIRYHKGKFWIYFGDPDAGYFMTTATNAAGPWEPLHLVLGEKGWDDCCPFWDDDGQGYLIETNFSDNYKIHLFKLTEDGKSIIKNSDGVIHQSEGSEANKLYKINSMYYHLFSEVKQEGRAIMMERSNAIYGPYTAIKQLSHAQKEWYEPNQGALVQTQKGDWYFLTHHGRGDWSGRIISLLPVTWKDGWPIIGQAGADTIGAMVWMGKMPVDHSEIVLPETSDEFDSTQLAAQWEWNYQPRADKWSLAERRGWLRLKAFMPLQQNNLLTAGNTITQRVMRTKYKEVIIKVDISKMADGQHAGLSHFGAPKYTEFGIVCNGHTKRLESTINGKITTERTVKANEIWLKSTWGLDGKSQYYFSIDGTHYTAAGKTYQLLWQSYRGDRIAVYNYNNKADAGYIDVDFFHYQYDKGK